MIIKEKKFIIKHVSGNNILFVKNKQNKYDIKGYFTSIENCIKRASSLKIIDLEYYNRLVKSKNKLKTYAQSIYNSIKQLDKDVNGF